jgi:hypothetical protein
MAELLGKAAVTRVVELGEREATVLEHDGLRVMVDDMGGMIPELSVARGRRRVNAHWLPWFRSSSGRPYDDAVHGAFWKANLLYQVAGSFPCMPNFGPGHIIGGVNMPPHGWTANLPWRPRGSGIDGEGGAGWALSSMESPDRAMPLSFRKLDVLVPEQNVHYISIQVKNSGAADIEICAGWHNTLGAPFLAEGCRLSTAADGWITAPTGSEFDTTTRLIPGAEFSTLNEAPLATGGRADLSSIPGPLGFTDFAAGRISGKAHLGWSSLVNPFLKMAYICFFPGPAAAPGDDIILRFNDLWMQYGGRPFTPWAPYEGGSDLTYCLGTENSVSAFAQGLEYSRQAKKLLGAPTVVTIPGGGEKTLRYGVLFAAYENGVLDGGVCSLEGDTNALVCKGKTEYWRFNADPGFARLRALEKKTG